MKPYRPTYIYYVITSVILIVTFIYGYFEASRDIEGTRRMLEESLSAFRFLRDLPKGWLFLLIFINNAFKALLAIVLGILFGIFPLYMAIVNGRLIGMAAAITAARYGMPAVFVGLLPHGVIEMAAFVIAIANGIWIGVKLIRRSKKESFGNYFKAAMKRYAIYVLPLMLIAALIEAYITPAILASVIRGR